MATLADVGKTIQSLRRGKGLTQSQLAERLNVSYQAVSKWEGGRALPDTALLVPLATALETSVDFILEGGVRMTAYKKRVCVADIQKGVADLAGIGRYIGRDNTVYQGMVQGINARMNIDIEEMLADERLTECLVAELLIQSMMNGHYVDATDVATNMKVEKWKNLVIERANGYGMV